MRMHWRSRWGAGAALGLLAVVLIARVVAHGGLAPAREEAGPAAATVAPRVGALAPDFELTDVNTGQPVRLAALRGRPVWINFWATWCEECKEELPTMKQLYARYKSQGLALVGVDMREDPAQVRSFTHTFGYDWLIVIDEDVQVRTRYDTVGIPNHLFVDAQGVIRAVSLGHLTDAAMAADLATILAP